MSRSVHNLDRRPAAAPRATPPRPSPPRPASEPVPRLANGRRVRGLTRGLAILRALNENNYASALQLSRITDLPRPTVYRLLDTLIAAGYVAHGTRPDIYRLTIAVRALSDGFNDEAWMTEIAAPIIAELGQQ